jgi:glutaredoxin
MGQCFGYMKKKDNLCLVSKYIIVITTGLGTDRVSAYYSKRLKQLLGMKRIRYEEFDLSLLEPWIRDQRMNHYPECRKQLPVLYANGKFIGDYWKIQELEDQGILENTIYLRIKKKESGTHHLCDMCAYNDNHLDYSYSDTYSDSNSDDSDDDQRLVLIM